MRYLTKDDALAAVWGGLVFGAGGGGLEAGLRNVDAVFELGQPRLAALDDFADDSLAVVTTGVGAPGPKKKRVIFPSDALRSLYLLEEKINAHSEPGAKIVGTIIGHPGAGMVRSWLLSALDERYAVLDCATNGRGHPSVRMGGLGITDDLTHRIFLTAAGGLDDVDGRIELTVESPLGLGSDIIRRASELLGGSISAARGPFSIGFLKEAGAVGSISASIELGRAMLDAEGGSAESKIDAVVNCLGGTVSAQGKVTSNSTKLDGAYDVGNIVLDSGKGEVVVGVVNEFLTLDVDGERLSTFPDLIVLLSASDGLPVGAAVAAAGDDIVVITVPRNSIPIGKGAYEKAAYPKIERLLDKDLTSFL